MSVRLAYEIDFAKELNEQQYKVVKEAEGRKDINLPDIRRHNELRNL